MWWNPRGEMMCSAEGWQSREELPMSEACWTTYAFRTVAPVRQRTVRRNPPCSYYLSDFFFPLSLSLSLSHSLFPAQLRGELCSRSSRCLSLCTFHVSYHTFDLSVLFAGACKVWATVGCQGQWFSTWHGGGEWEKRKGGGLLFLTSPSPRRRGNTWRLFWTPGASI